MNPGGDPSHPHLSTLTVRSSIDALPTKTINRYLDTEWVGRGVLQRRIRWLLTQLAPEPRLVAAANLSFVRSRDKKGAQLDTFAELCWPVHERILEIVRPKLVLVYGDDVYRYLDRRFGPERHERFRVGHGNWECRAFCVPGRFRVASVPHMSYYAIDHHPEVVKWLRAQMR